MTEPVDIKAERRMAAQNDPQIGGDCDRCSGSGEVIVGEKNVRGMMKPRYGPCPDCDDDELTPAEEHRNVQQTGEVFEVDVRGDGL